MIRARLYVLFIFLLLSPVVLVAQSHYWRKGKVNRFYRKHVMMQKDPEVVKKKLVEAVGKTEKSARVLFCLLLAEQYERAGDFANAEKYYLEANNETKKIPPKIFASYLPNLSGTVYDSYDRLAYFYLRTGNLRRAAQLFEESAGVRNKVFPERSVHRVNPIVGMGSWQFKKGNYDETYRLFDQATRMMNRATTTHYDYDNINRLFLKDLAELCLSLSKHDEALQYINKLAIASSGVAKFNSKLGRRLETARIFELKARYYLLEGSFDRSQQYLDRARVYNPEKIAGTDVTFKLLKTQAVLYWRQGNIDRANEAFKKLVMQYRAHVRQNFMSMSEYEKEQFYNTLKSDFDLFNAYVLEVPSTAREGMVEEMFNHVINTKALLLNETNRGKNTILASGDATLIGRFKEWEQSKSKLASAYFEKQMETRLDSLEKKIDLLEKQINQSTGLFQEANRAHTWQNIRDVLKEDEAALEIINVNIARKSGNVYAKDNGLSDSTVYVVLFLKKNMQHPEFFHLANGNQLEDRFLKYYRNAIYSQQQDKLSYDQFWLPIRKRLADIRRVYLSPDGVFNQINLNTLQNPTTENYLIDEMELVYLTNTADLLRERSDAAPEQKAVLVGRPAYKMETSREAYAASDSPQYGLRNLFTEELMSFKEQEFADLPGTEAEINRISEILRAQQLEVNTLTGAGALEENVKSVKRPVVLHIATHGFFVEDSANAINPMIRSGVVLAGIQNKEKTHGDDGILTAYEATNLDLENTALVVLSACQTGLGEIRNGAGVYGLQRAIIVAGARNLLMSLWKVDDAATATLMVELYKNRTARDNLGAFRDAQLALRKKYAHPFYWGAFIMLGN